MIASRDANRISLLAGLAVLLLAVLSLARTAAPVCGGLARNYAPMIAFELARSIGDLHAIFGSSQGACRAAMAAQMDRDNWIDSLLFIPLYGSFLVFFFLGVRNTATAFALSRAGIFLTIVACTADYAENLCLFHISSQPDAASPWLTWLAFATETKWVLLGVVGTIGGLILWRRGHGLLRLAIFPCAAGAAVALTSIPATGFAGPYLPLAISLGWIVFLMIDVATAFGLR